MPQIQTQRRRLRCAGVVKATRKRRWDDERGEQGREDVDGVRGVLIDGEKIAVPEWNERRGEEAVDREEGGTECEASEEAAFGFLEVGEGVADDGAALGAAAGGGVCGGCRRRSCRGCRRRGGRRVGLW